MSQERAFLQQLQDNPADDTVRLVYADWLEERDDPRGRYLRAEVEIASLSPDDPGYQALEEELQELRGGIEPEWLALAGKRFDLVLLGYLPPRKILVIKLIRELSGIGLKEAKDLSEALPAVILRGVNRQRAEEGREHLCYSGGQEVCQAVIRPTGASLPLTMPEGEYQVMLDGLADPARKIAIIKVVRELTGLGLKEAKDLVEAAPRTFKEGISQPEALTLQRKLEEAGARVSIHPPVQKAPTTREPVASVTGELVVVVYNGLVDPGKKIGVIKVLRELTGLGLKDAKDFVEGPPSPVKEQVPNPEAQVMKRQLEVAGARISLVAGPPRG